MRESLLTARAIIGDAVARLNAGTPISSGQALSWTNETEYRNAISGGTNQAVQKLRGGGDANGRLLAERFNEVQEALHVIADLWKSMPDALFRAVLAALDTAAFRVDPWLTGIAERRLQRMIAEGAPFRLGAYGWVDAPAPYAGLPGGPLAPGPTRAGLLHAPSPAQALTAAVLRDAAVRYPGSDRWRLALDSAKIRAAMALAERVRLGVHPYEALGLEVEKVAGDWDTVRILRKEFPLAADQQERRVCDGQKVLKAAREGALPAIAGVRATLAVDSAARRSARHVFRFARRRRRLRARNRSRRPRQRGNGSSCGPRRAAGVARHSHAARGHDRTCQRVGARACCDAADLRKRRSRTCGRPGVCGRG